MYKGILAIKSLHNFINSRPENSNGYTEKLKVKYSATTAIAGKFPNGTGFLEYLLAKEAVPLSWNNYCALMEADCVIWEGKADELSKGVLLLENSKNEVVKKNLCLAFAR